MATDTDFKVKHGLVVTEDIELGHATDTTLSRSSGGVLAVEGVVVPTISSTSTLTNKTLTSPVLSGLIATTLTSGSEQVLISDTSDTTLFKVVQLGTGNAFEVHDQATDSSAFFANNAGKVGILKNPSSGLTYDVEIGGETLSERFTSSVSGSVGSPAFRFSSDSNNGMYLGGTDILGFSTAGTERMTISASGVVNIAGSLTVAGSAVGGASTLDDLDNVKIASNFSQYYGTSTDHDNASYNTSVGSTALDSITTGSGNTCFGAKAGTGITDSTGNILIGSECGGTIVTGASYNIGIGSSSMAVGNFDGGNYNIGIGAFTMRTISSGDNNIGIGGWSAKEITSGSDNIAIGYGAIKELQTGSKNIGIGGASLDGVVTASHNIAIGYETLTSATSGGSNIAIGNYAINNMDAESHNIAIGYTALGGVINGAEYNIAIGNEALLDTTTGDFNVAIGYQASQQNETGEYNVALGYNAHLNITGTSSNTLIGSNAGKGQSGSAGGHDNVVVGKGAYYNWTTGSQNVLMGKDSGYKIRSGTGNVVLGHQGHSQNWQDGNYNTAVGYQAQSHMNGGANNISIGYTAGNNITTGDHNVVIGAADVASATGDSQLSISDGDGGTTWITGDSNGGVFQQAGLVAVSGNTTLTLAQSGAYIYWTAGTLTLPASGVVGTQYTVFNNTGGSATVALNASNCSIVSGWASNAAVADHDATSYVCVAANNWVQVGA